MSHLLAEACLANAARARECYQLILLYQSDHIFLLFFAANESCEKSGKVVAWFLGRNSGFDCDCGFCAGFKLAVADLSIELEGLLRRLHLQLALKCFTKGL